MMTTGQKQWVAKSETVDYATPSEDLFERLTKEDPERLLGMLNTLSPGFLTHAAEIAGRELPSEQVVGALLELLHHQSPVVREGAIYGLSYHADDRIDEALRKIAESDQSPGVREAARTISQREHDFCPCPLEKHQSAGVQSKCSGK